MKTITLLRSILFIIFLTTVARVSAQHDHGSHGSGESHATHEHQPPHGGEMKEVGKYHVEMVAELLLKKDQLTFYLFKTNLKPITNEGISGTISIRSKDSIWPIEPLVAKGNGAFSAQFKSIESFNCEVIFTIKGKSISTNFTHEGLMPNMKSKDASQMNRSAE
jgi:hypothetical protein